MTYGAIATCMCFDWEQYTHGCCHWQPRYSEDDPTHAIAIVGWNDTIRPECFENPGAWLCKNSWGDGYCYEGYFWISYFDKHCTKNPEMGAVCFKNVEPMRYDHVYYHDYHGWRDTREEVTEAFNVFTAVDGAILSAVSFITAVDSVDYTVMIYDSFDGTDLSGVLHTQSGWSEFRGLHTVDLDEVVNLQQDDQFYVYLQLFEGGHAYDRTSAVPVLLGGDYRVTVTSSSTPGQSYYKTGSDWADLYEENHSANFCMKGLSNLGFDLEADCHFGSLPFEVNFNASSDENVTSWLWDFHDGDSATGQAVTHVFENPGIYDLTVHAVIDGHSRYITERQMIYALTDTLSAEDFELDYGDPVIVELRGTNLVPAREFRVPIEYGGDLEMTLDSFSVDGCCTEYFSDVAYTTYSPDMKRAILSINTSPEQEPLPPTCGPIVRLFFSYSGHPESGTQTTIEFDGYTCGSIEMLPVVRCDMGEYTMVAVNSEVVYSDCCIDRRGNVDNDPSDMVDIADLIYMIDYMFGSGVEPECWREANINGNPVGDISHQVDMSDLVYLVEYMFGQGPLPPRCL